MNNPFVLDFTDRSLFGNDAGEDEPIEVLASYFVDQQSFKDFFGTQHVLQIARGRKGMGKSALLAKLAHELGANDRYLVLRLTGSDFTGMGEFTSEDHSVLINQWQQVICTRISMELGARFKLAKSDSKSMMVEAAEIAGLKGRNLIGSLIARLRTKDVGLTTPTIGDNALLLKRVLSEDESSMPTIWLLIDDIDSTFNNTQSLRNKISSFFSACRRLATTTNGVFVRASVRADVWPSLRDNEDLDKCEQYITDIRWTNDELSTILAKRILSFAVRNRPSSRVALWNLEANKDQIIELAFAHRLRWGEHTVPPTQVVNILAAKRPRWMAQLCRNAGLQAARLGKTRIGNDAIHAMMQEFSKLRVSDLYKEHAHQFTDIKRLVEAFARGERRYSTLGLQGRIVQHYIAKVGALNVPAIDGSNETSGLSLAHFLFKIGFIQARSDGSGALSFVSFEERPNLLTTSVNFDDGMAWEIQPPYRVNLGLHP